MQTQDYPGLFQSADAVATSSQKWHFRCLKIFLVALFLGAFLSLFPNTTKEAAIAAAVLFATTIGLTLLTAFKRFDRAWYNTRAVAESVKTRTWSYMMQADPYNTDDSAARRAFTSGLACILKDNTDATKIIPASNADEITQEMIRIRALPMAEKKLFYKEHRVDAQHCWYIEKAKFNRTAHTLWITLLVSFQIGALACVIIKLLFPQFTPIPTALFTTLAGIAISWSQAKRFGDLSTSYNLTAHEISIIRTHYAELSQEQDFSSFVRDSEAAFSREHTQWIARRGI